jgi:hypothetical protein
MHGWLDHHIGRYQFGRSGGGIRTEHGRTSENSPPCESSSWQIAFPPCSAGSR